MPHPLQVYITLNGQYGISPETLLVNASTNFAPGSSEEFMIKVSDTGLLSSVDVRVMATGSVAKWSLERLEVTPTATGRTARFTCKESWVTPGAPVRLKLSLPEAEYRLAAETGEGSG